jgi:hypothetical protein
MRLNWPLPKNKAISMPTQSILISYALGILGGIAGGAVGYFVFFYATRQGLYPMVLPGALVGLGCGAMLGMKSNAVGVVCGVCALALGLLIEWQFAPFERDRSLGFFLSHVNQLRSMTLILIILGALLAFAFGRGREGACG